MGSPRSLFDSSKMFLDMNIRQPSMFSSPENVDNTEDAAKILLEGYVEDFKSVSTDASKSYVSSHVSFFESDSEDEQVIIVDRKSVV